MSRRDEFSVGIVGRAPKPSMKRNFGDYLSLPLNNFGAPFLTLFADGNIT